MVVEDAKVCCMYVLLNHVIIMEFVKALVQTTLVGSERSLQESIVRPRLVGPAMMESAAMFVSVLQQELEKTERNQACVNVVRICCSFPRWIDPLGSVLPVRPLYDDIAAFKGDPCKNYGYYYNVPSIVSTGHVRFHCLPGFTGDRCEVKLDECTSKPCENIGPYL